MTAGGVRGCDENVFKQNVRVKYSDCFANRVFRNENETRVFPKTVTLKL